MRAIAALQLLLGLNLDPQITKFDDLADGNGVSMFRTFVPSGL